MAYRPIGYFAAYCAFDELEFLETEIGSYCEKLTAPQRAALSAALTEGTDNPGAVSRRVWGIFLTDRAGFSNALNNA